MSELTLEQENRNLKEQICQLKQQLQVYEKHDSLTGLLKADFFYQQVEKRFQDYPEQKYCIYYLDIERFKLFNEWYGRKEGDNLLCHIAAYLRQKERNEYGIAAHFNADIFVILLPVIQKDIENDETEDMERVEAEVLGWLDKYKTKTNFLPVIGVYPITDFSIPVSVMCDKAALAVDSVKGNYNIRIAKYDGQMGQMLAKEQELLIDVKTAMENREFLVYMQPKCNMRTGKIIGAEALIRWQHPKKGMISPAEFIPVLEKNNFIFDLDMYIWDEVCCFIRKWLDAGHKAVPISVNVSRVDIFDKNLCEILSNLLEKYKLEPSLLELEITESAYTQDTAHIIGVVKKLRESGFIVLMDDFGSGYSSLNMLKDVDVDILKIDMKFLDMTKQTAKRGSDILESVLQMAKWMNLKVIAEGIESTEQVNFLLRIGCEYGQGYYFYKPMDIQNFEAVLENRDNVDYEGMMMVHQHDIQFEDLLNSNTMSDIYLNNILGAVAIYDMYEGELELKQVNEGYYQVTNSNSMEIKKHQHKIIENVCEEDREIIWNGLREAQAHPLLGTKMEIRCITENHEWIWLSLRVFFLGEQNNRKRFYASLNNITKQKKIEIEYQKMKELVYKEAKIKEISEDEFQKAVQKKELEILSSRFLGNIFELEVGEDYWSCNLIYIGMAEEIGYTKQEYKKVAENRTPIEFIHPVDREEILTKFQIEIQKRKDFFTQIRVLCKDGAVFFSDFHAWYIGEKTDKIIYLIQTEKKA